MNQHEHAQEARKLLTRAQQESASGGNQPVAAEFLWGAFAHCLIAIALNEGLCHDSHGAFKRIAQHIDAAQGGNEWRSRFGSAERLHHHFYHGNLPTAELRTHTRRTADGTLKLLGML